MFHITTFTKPYLTHKLPLASLSTFITKSATGEPIRKMNASKSEAEWNSGILLGIGIPFEENSGLLAGSF